MHLGVAAGLGAAQPRVTCLQEGAQRGRGGQLGQGRVHAPCATNQYAAMLMGTRSSGRNISHAATTDSAAPARPQ